MNNFVISVGTYIPSLTDKSVEIVKSIDKVSVDMGGIACKVPFAPEYIEKVIAKDTWVRSARRFGVEIAC